MPIDVNQLLDNKTRVVVFKTPDGELHWTQAIFARGEAVGVKAQHVYSYMGDPLPMWVEFPADAEIVAALPHPLAGKMVRITRGEHAGTRGVVVQTHPPRFTASVQIGREVAEVPVADLELA